MLDNEMMKLIVEKIRVGDGITDEELDEAITLYVRLTCDLEILGPHFHLVLVSVHNTLARLTDYKKSREAAVTVRFNVTED